jgi:GT2 family glycosyltransferase
MNIAALTTCHNRRNYTSRCLVSLKEAIDHCKELKVDFFIVDDGSIDGTLSMIKNDHSEAIVILGDGCLYWNRGMIKAWSTALKNNNKYDAYLLFNDDVIFFESALDILYDTFSSLKKLYLSPIAITGALQDPVTGETAYGGLLKNDSNINPLRFTHVRPKSLPIQCDTLNMNCALIDAKAVDAIGILDKTFHHSFGDLDYGLRLKKAGGHIFLAPKYIGLCERNTTTNTWLDSSVGRFGRLQKILSPKGMPLRERMHYCMRHSGIFWPLYWIAPYLAILLFNIPLSGKRQIV